MGSGQTQAQSQALRLDHLLAGAAVPPGRPSLAGLGAKLRRASELAAPHAVEEGAGFPTAAPVLEHLFPGVLPRGGVVELVGRRSSGRFSLELAALASTTSTGSAAALVDLGDHLDPQLAERAGVDLRYLLWARPRRVKEALAAAEMLLATGFLLVVADLGLRPRARFVPDAAWLRLARAAQAQRATLLLSAPWRVGGIASDAVLAGGGTRSFWKGGERGPRLLAGANSRWTLEKLGRSTPGVSAGLSLFCPETLLRDPGDSGNAIESGIEAHDPRNAAPFHGRQMERVAG